MFLILFRIKITLILENYFTENSFEVILHIFKYFTGNLKPVILIPFEENVGTFQENGPKASACSLVPTTNNLGLARSGKICL